MHFVVTQRQDHEKQTREESMITGIRLKRPLFDRLLSSFLLELEVPCISGPKYIRRMVKAGVL